MSATSEAGESLYQDHERHTFLRRKTPPSNHDKRPKLSFSNGTRSVDLLKSHAASPTQMVPDSKHLAARARARKRISGFSSSRSEISNFDAKQTEFRNVLLQIFHD